MTRLVRAPWDREGQRSDLLPTDDDLAEAKRFFATRGPELGLSPVTLFRFSRYAGDVWLALESLQVTGSFKVRGALYALSRLAARGARRVVAASAGNHGAGVAYAAQKLGIEATVVVPASAPRKKIDAIAGASAEVIEHEGGYDAAEAAAIALAAERGDPFLSPYDDVDVLTGNGASLGFEIAAGLALHGATPGCIIAPFGGGGLVTGLACALPEARIFGAQSEASPAFAMSLESGEAVTTLEPAETLADGLEGGISARAFARTTGLVDGVFVMTEHEIADAMRFAYRELGLVLEGSAAAALAPLKHNRAFAVRETGDLVVVLTGRNVDPERLGQLVC